MSTVISKVRQWGVTSDMAYLAGFASILGSFAAWRGSRDLEKADHDRADRWGIFVGLWAPTIIGLGNALRHEEAQHHPNAPAQA